MLLSVMETSKEGMDGEHTYMDPPPMRRQTFFRCDRTNWRVQYFLGPMDGIFKVLLYTTFLYDTLSISRI